MINSPQFFEALTEQGFEFFCGVPDSLLKDLCAYISDTADERHHVITVNEGNAVALATGYYLATKKIPVVYMQNSGLGNAVNPLTSLTDLEIYGIPILLIIGWRGEPGIKDEPQHKKMGRIQIELCTALGLPYEILPDQIEGAKDTLGRAKRWMDKYSAPFVLLVRKGTFAPYEIRNETPTHFVLNREEVLRALIPHLGKKDIIISTTGKTSREIFELRKARGEGHEKDFLTVGSMGHSSSIALGIAMEKSDRRVWCIDGDGALLMHMGSLAVVGKVTPKNFVHILINNFVHDSVGGQPTAIKNVHAGEVAKACGYTQSFLAKNENEVLRILKKIEKLEGPIFFEIQCNKGARKDLGRPTTTPSQNKDAFMRFLQT